MPQERSNKNEVQSIKVQDPDTVLLIVFCHNPKEKNQHTEQEILSVVL